MSKKILLCAIAVIMAALTACSGEEKEAKKEADGKIQYFAYRDRIIGYDDAKESGQAVCSRSGCQHNTLDCDAYIGNDLADVREYYDGVVHEYNGHLYVIEKVTGESDVDEYWLVQCDISGDNRQRVVKLNGKESWIPRGVGNGGIEFIDGYMYYAEIFPITVLDREEDKNNPERDQKWLDNYKYYMRFNRVALSNSAQVEIISDYEPFFVKFGTNSGCIRIAGTADKVWFVNDNIDGAVREGYSEEVMRIWCYDTAEGTFEQQTSIPAKTDIYDDINFYSQGGIAPEGKIYFTATDAGKFKNKFHIVSCDLRTGEMKAIYSTDYATIQRGDESKVACEADWPFPGLCREVEYTSDFIYLYEGCKGYCQVKILDYAGNLADILEFEDTQNYMCNNMTVKAEGEDYVIFSVPKMNDIAAFQMDYYGYMREHGLSVSTAFDSSEGIAVRLDKNQIGSGKIELKRVMEY